MLLALPDTFSLYLSGRHVTAVSGCDIFDYSGLHGNRRPTWRAVCATGLLLGMIFSYWNYNRFKIQFNHIEYSLYYYSMCIVVANLLGSTQEVAE